MRKLAIQAADRSMFYDNDDPQYKTARVGYLRIAGENRKWHSRMPHLENEKFRSALAEAMEIAEREKLMQTAAEAEKEYADGGRFVLESKDNLFAFRCGFDVKYCFVYDKERVKFMPQSMMKVVMVKPNKPAYVTEIGSDYQSLRKAVGGLIEPIGFLHDPNAIMVGNEEAKLIGMEGNRRFPEGIVAGPFFICGDDGEDFCSLSDELCEKYAELFSQPHTISQDEVERDMKIIIFGL
ncbi:MAG: DUF3846 domain-containing protein [Lachnospiraceae bacterium]|nr:DUF3846 domain-containing protein [Ruminococcus sp.]MCM1276438.1 DUF3846 domain-containing protein [Lachnospiraceae bacterium]